MEEAPLWRQQVQSHERTRLLDRLVQLNRGSRVLADAYASAPIEELRAVVVRVEAAADDIKRRGSRLAAIWSDDNAVIVHRAADASTKKKYPRS